METRRQFILKGAKSSRRARRRLRARPSSPRRRRRGQDAQDPPVEPLRARLRQVVRPVRQGVGRQARARGDGGSRGLRRRRPARHRRGGRPVRSRHPHVHRPGQRLRGARHRPQGRGRDPREEVRQAGRAGPPQHLQSLHQEAVRPVRTCGCPTPATITRKCGPTSGSRTDRSTYEDLVKAAPEIKKKYPQMQIPIGVGLSARTSTRTWPCAICSGATAAPSRTRTATSS